MATLDTATITSRVRAIMETAAGDLRTITADTYRSLANESLSDDELSLRALEKPRYRIRYTNLSRAPESPPMPSNVKLIDVTMVVTVVRHIPPVANDLDSSIDAIKAAAANDFDVISQALEYPGNVNVAGIVSGMMRSTGSSTVRVQFPQGGDRQQPGIMETDHPFTFKVQVAPAIS